MHQFNVVTRSPKTPSKHLNVDNVPAKSFGEVEQMIETLFKGDKDLCYDFGYGKEDLKEIVSIVKL